MRAHDYVKAEPLEQPPAGTYTPEGQRREAVLDALRGVELGAHDRRIIGWMTSRLDDATNRTIVSLLLRLRDTSVLGMMALLERIEEQAKKARAEHRGPVRWAAGDDRSGGPL
jgi:hypothetical protein